MGFFFPILLKQSEEREEQKDNNNKINVRKTYFTFLGAENRSHVEGGAYFESEDFEYRMKTV